MGAALTSLYQKLGEGNLVIPYLESAFDSDLWPDEVSIPMKKKDYSQNDWFFPSTHAVPDARWIYYQLHPDHRNNVRPRQDTTSGKLSMLLGTFLHTVIQDKMKRVGLVEDKHIEVPLRDELVHARGRADLIFPEHPQTKKDLVIDIKTTNARNYSMVSKVTMSYKLQLLCYMKWYGELTGQEINEGVILLVEAAQPFRMKELKVSKDDKAMDALYEKWNYVRECIALNSPPPEKCCTLNSATMDKCNARSLCLPTWENQESLSLIDMHRAEH